MNWRKNKKKIAIVFVVAALVVAQTALGATNINSDTAQHWAWNDLVGWIDFYNTNTITVSSQKLTGYASSSAGDISLDCLTTRIGDICDASSYGVTNDGNGNLSGWAWNDAWGWISFDCANNPGGCSQSNYRVLVNPTTGIFTNYAWNDAMGWISVNCSDPNICGTSQYDVRTSWIATSTSGTLDSSTFDTGVSGGAQINSIFWRGNLPANTSVDFQIAVSNASSGPWSYIGPDGTSNTYYDPGAADTSKSVDYVLHHNYRYFRYRVRLTSNQAQTATPRIDDIIVNWSP